MSRMPTIIAVESCTGSGKGFLLKYISQHGLLPGSKVHVCLQDDSIDQVLDYNKDPRRCMLTKEMHFLLSHVHNINESVQREDVDVVLIEGSPVSDRRCYFEVGCQNKLEKELYEDWFEFLRPFWNVDAHVILAADPHSSLDRVVNNSKKEQAFLDLAKLSRTIALYDTVFADWPRIECIDHFEDNEPALEVMRMRIARKTKELVKLT